MNVLIVIPTLNAASFAPLLLPSIKEQIDVQFDIFVIDSSSDDCTSSIFQDSGATVHIIPRHHFNHGRTRQIAVELFETVDIVVFMTQDSILSDPHALSNLLCNFRDPSVGAVCGRQLPHKNASPIAAHARLFNYPADSSVKSFDDIPRIGIKSAFISNSFAAYRREALMCVGGFPSDVIFGEDTCVAAKMLLAGWKIAYCAEAAVYHSHNYYIADEFRRCFDIGVFHSREKWFLESLGKPEGEGKRFVFSELRYLLKHAPWLIPSALIRTAAKLLGYKLGQREHALPLKLKQKLSMNKGYWKK